MRDRAVNLRWPEEKSAMPETTTRAYVLLVLLSALNLLNYVDRYLLFSFANDVIADLHLSYFEFSFLSSVLFSVFYALAGVLLGYLADRWRRLRVVAIGAAAWSLLTALTGLSVNLLQFGLARSFISVGESALTPAATSVLKDAFPSKRLSLVTALFYLGFPLGSGASLLLAGALGPVLGWRGTFVLLGLVGLPLSALTLFLREPGRKAAEVLEKIEPRLFARRLVGDLGKAFTGAPALGYLTIASILMQFSLGGMALEQVWLVHERGYSVQRAQLLFGLLYVISATFALIGGGMLGDRLRRHSTRGRYFALLISTVFLVPGVVFRIVAPHTILFYVLAVGSNMFASLTIGPFYALIQELSPPDLRSTVYAFVLLVTTLGGFSVGSACFGWLSTHLLTAGVSEPLSVSFVVFNCIGLLSAPFIYLALRCDREKSR